MRINNSALQSNGLLNIIRAGQNKSSQKEDDETKNGVNNSSSMLDSLMDRKQSVTDMKNELIGKTLENGGELEDIKPQIEAYEEQLQLIDEEITQTMSKQAEEITGEDDTSKTDEATTKQEFTEKRNRDMLTLSGSMEQIKILASVKTKMENQANTWSSEIKKDGLHASEIKKQNLSDLKCSVSKLNENIMNTITDTIQATNQGDDTISADKQTDKLDDSIDKEDTGKIQADDDYKKKFNLE
ncbi:MAG: hypothetical protein VB018_06565 [Lachnospiraceae bacterium]|nr:hypothetical protein [Lachnospiraceae bacterium]